MAPNRLDELQQEIEWTYRRARRRAARLLFDDRRYVERRFRATFGRSPNLDNPQSFNEKIQWLKLNYRNPLMTRLADKFEVKAYVQEKVGRQHATVALGLYDSVAEFQRLLPDLPQRFMLKATHGCRWNLFVADKARLTAADLRRAQQWLDSNYYDMAREWAYKHIPPRLLAEAIVEPDDAQGLVEYRCWCLNGRLRMIAALVRGAQPLRFNNYDRDWQSLPFRYFSPEPTTEFPRPPAWTHMVEMAETLSAGWPFMRVDFLTGTLPRIAELTFYPSGGFGRFYPPQADLEMGAHLELPQAYAFEPRPITAVSGDPL